MNNSSKIRTNGLIGSLVCIGVYLAYQLVREQHKNSKLTETIKSIKKVQKQIREHENNKNHVTYRNTIKSIKQLINEKRLSWDEYFMAFAFLTSARSSCSRLNVGCVITKDNKILATGYNGFLAGAEHKSIMRDGHEQATAHAEFNAVVNVAAGSNFLNGSIVYVTHYPCINCAKLLIQARVKYIYYNDDYRNDELVDILMNNSGVKLIKFETKLDLDSLASKINNLNKMESTSSKLRIIPPTDSLTKLNKNNDIFAKKTKLEQTHKSDKQNEQSSIKTVKTKTLKGLRLTNDYDIDSQITKDLNTPF